jgi:hypothetical protein
MRRAYEKTDEFRERYRWRAGEEGTNSFGKQKTGLGKLSVRGMKAVRFAVTMKWLGVNIMRASMCEIVKNRGNNSSPEGNGMIVLISACVRSICNNIRRFFRNVARYPAQTDQTLVKAE